MGVVEMQITIRKIGNSNGVIIPKHVLDEYSLSERDLVELSLTDDGFLIKKVEKPVRKRRSIQELFSDYEDGYIQGTETDWGKPVGDEVW